MYSPVIARSPASSIQCPGRPLNRRAPVSAHGPGWRLAEGEAGCWRIELQRGHEPLMTWSHMLRSLRSLADCRGMRPLILDLSEAARVDASAADAVMRLFAELERRGLRVAAFVGPDLIHAARLHRLISASAPRQGRCFLTEHEAIEWVHPSPPPIPPPLRVPNIAAPRV